MAGLGVEDIVQNGCLEEPDLNEIFLEERFDMECRQELDRVERLSKVTNAIKNRLGTKIARNMQIKKVTGPLGNPSPAPPPSKPQPKPNGHVEELSYKQRVYDSIKKSQNQELDSLRREGIVKKSLADRRMRARAKQMFNHRLYIDDASQNNRKTSILVTGVEPEQEVKTAACLRQESIMYIDSFFQTPSKSKRVLRRLNSQQLRGISDCELRRQSFNGFNNKAPESSRVRSRTDPPKIPPFQGTARKHGNGISTEFGSKSRKLNKVKPTKLGKKLKPGVGKKRRVFRKHHGSSSLEDDIVVSPKKKHAERRRLHSTSRKLKSAVRDSWASLKSSVPRKSVDLPVAHGAPPPPSGSHDFARESHDLPSRSHDPSAFSPVMFSVESQNGISEDNAVEDLSSLVLENGSHDDHVTSTLREIDQEEEGYMSESESGTYSDPEPIPHSKTNQSEARNRITVDGEDSTDCYEDKDEVTDLQQPPNLNQNTFQSRRHFSSPAIHVGISQPVYPGDHVTPHGFYTAAKVEVNPFEIHFREGYEENIAVKQTETISQCTGTVCGDDRTLTRTLTLEHSEEVTSKFVKQKSIVVEQKRDTEIPPHAFDDPNFIRFVNSLGRDPIPADYITYKLRTIGDQIDQQYDEKLNQALDAIFVEAVKSQVSLESFKAISKRLILEGQRLQDGIFLVTCFGRRLAEMVPTVGDNVTAFTEIVLNTYASDFLLSIGGWGRLVESYHQVETLPSCYEYDYYDDEYQDYANERVFRRSKQTQDPPQIITVNPPEVEVPNFTPHYPLRRVISVEVLFHEPETEHAQSPDYYGNEGRKFSLARSASTTSLDVSSANFQSSNFSFYSQLSRRRISEVVRVETTHLEEMTSYHYGRRGSTASVCSNVSAIRLVGETRTLPRNKGGKTPKNDAPDGEYLDLHLDTPSHSQNGSIANQIRDDNSDHSCSRSIALPLTIAAIAVGSLALVGFLYFRSKR